jgi:3-methyladenine DNA glycosylase AlkC
MRRPKKIIKQERTIDNKGYLRLLESYKQSKEVYTKAFFEIKKCLKEIKEHEGKRFILEEYYQNKLHEACTITHALRPLLRTLEIELNIPDDDGIYQLDRDEEER